jgi:peptidoglycan/xylan/chitin deacetylase (PgdA/CDA1 family)
MRRKREPVPRAKAAGHWLGGILLLGLLAGGVVVAAVLLWENLDVRQLAPTLASDPGPLPNPEPAVAPGIQSGTFPVVLFNPDRNRAFYPDDAYHPRVIGRWRDLIESLGGLVEEVATLAPLDSLEPGELLVVPEAPCLSAEEVAAIQDHVDAGGGVVSNWAVGARDEDCEWRGWGTVADLTGADDVRELGMREALYLAVPGGIALSPGLDPGTRIELRPEPSLALNVSGPRVFWSDWALNPSPDESGGGADAAAATRSYTSGGRATWFGFQLAQAATPRDSLHLDRLVKNGILWAAGRVQAAPAPWPQGQRATLLLVQDVEAEYQNAAAMADLLSDMDLPGTFFAVSQLVMDDAELGPALASVGEVGSQTSDHNPLAGLSYVDQTVRLRRSWTEIRDWVGDSPAGLRPPEEEFDANTLRAWKQAGGSYLLAVNQARSGSPELHRVDSGQPVVLLPRLLKDDYNVLVQEGPGRVRDLSQAFREGTRKLRAIGGLAVVAVHTQIVRSGRRLDAVRDVAQAAVEEGDWWITGARDAADWWRARSSVRITLLDPSQEAPIGDSLTDTFEAPGPGSQNLLPDIRVEGPDDEAVSGLWIDVVLPGGLAGTTPAVDGVPTSYNLTEWGVRVPLGDLLPGEPKIISFPSSGSPD